MMCCVYRKGLNVSSQVFLCNLALANIAKPAIQSINAAEPEAIACKQFYGHVLRVLLQSYPWRFAQKTEALAPVINGKPNRWQYAYARPVDCLKFHLVTDDSMVEYIPDPGGHEAPGGFPYAIEGQTIYCDVPQAYGVYTYDLTDPTLFSPLFEEAFGWHLAVRLAMPLTRDPKIRADAYQLAVKTEALASATDANEERATSDAPAEAVEVRS